MFIQQGHIKLIKSDCKYIYNQEFIWNRNLLITNSAYYNDFCFAPQE